MCLKICDSGTRVSYRWSLARLRQESSLVLISLAFQQDTDEEVQE